MEEEKNNKIEEELEEVVEEPQQDPFELISEKLKEQDEKSLKNTRHIKALYEEIKMLKNNFKLLVEDKEWIGKKY